MSQITGKVDYKTSKTYLHIIETARQLFWKYGFKKVSVEEVAAKAGVSKMTFYRYFKNKTVLATAVFDKVVNDGLLSFREIMDSDLTPVEKIQKFVMMKSEGANGISEDFLADFYNNPELGLKDYIEETTRKMWGEIIEDIRKAQERNILRRDFKPEILFWLSQKVQEIMSDKQVLKLYDNPQAMVTDFANLMFYGIAPRNEKNL